MLAREKKIGFKKIELRKRKSPLRRRRDGQLRSRTYRNHAATFCALKLLNLQCFKGNRVYLESENNVRAGKERSAFCPALSFLTVTLKQREISVWNSWSI